jgi:rubrerythrin
VGIIAEKEEDMNEPFNEEEALITASDLEMLREDLIGELEAINQYQDHILSIENADVVQVLEHIVEEEKEHVAELFEVINNLDSAQAEKFK